MGVQLIYNVVIVSGVQQHELVIHILTLSYILFSYRPLQSIEQSTLYYIVGPYYSHTHTHTHTHTLYIAVCICQCQPYNLLQMQKRVFFGVKFLSFLMVGILLLLFRTFWSVFWWCENVESGIILLFIHNVLVDCTVPDIKGQIIATIICPHLLSSMFF